VIPSAEGVLAMKPVAPLMSNARNEGLELLVELQSAVMMSV